MTTSLSTEQIKIVGDSFSFASQDGNFATSLYKNLFNRRPDLEVMFKGSMKEQAQKLSDMISIAINSLNHPGRLTQTLESLGRRHSEYGVSPEHYDEVKEALVSTLAQVIGERFTKEVRDSWVVFYDSIATAMIRGTSLSENDK